MYCLKMYIASPSRRTQAISNGLTRELEKETGGLFSLEVINVLESPERAVTDNIMATPTIIRETPLPAIRVTGNITDMKKIVARLGVGVVRPLGQERECDR